MRLHPNMPEKAIRTRFMPPRAAILPVLAIGVFWTTAPAQESRKLGWVDKAELSYLMTGGNAVTSTLGIRNSLVRTWANDLIEIQASAVRAHATTSSRRAVGTADEFSIVEQRTERLVAENYQLAVQYDRRITDRWAANAGLSWDRNLFTGVESRLVAAAGAGTVWIATAKTKFKTNTNLTYTTRKYVSAARSFHIGFQGTWDFERKLTETTTLSGQFVLDESLKDMSDWRGDMVNSLGVAMSKNLALKVSVRLFYANKPARERVPLDTENGSPTGLTVLHSLQKLDTFVTTSLVVNF
jgi:putative salt-induced outer membrane protein YdiY